MRPVLWKSPDGAVVINLLAVSAVSMIDGRNLVYMSGDSDPMVLDDNHAESLLAALDSAAHPPPVDTSKLDEIIRNLGKLQINDWDATQADCIVIGAVLEIVKQLRGGR